MFRIVITFALSLAATAARAGTTIEFFPNIGPTSPQEDVTYAASPSFDAYAKNAIGAMLDDVGSRGGSISNTPTAFERRAGNTASYFELLSTEFPSWRGDFAPAGAFAAERGTWWRLGTRVESDTPFVLTQLIKTTSGSTFSDEYDMATQIAGLGWYASTGFSPTLAVGINYGPDGVRGTADDVICDSAACDPFTQPLNLFAWLGHGQLDWIDQATLDDAFGGDKSALAADWTAFLSGAYGDFVPPYKIDYNYRLMDGTSTRASADYRLTVAAAVPEPATWTMMIIGFGAAGYGLRRASKPVAMLQGRTAA